MALSRRLLLLFSAAVLVGFASASSLLSDSVFQVSTGAMGRSLLQITNDCPVNFESQNYTIIKSKCKAPQYPPTECCAAFKEFACPFIEYINDLSNKCASTMFSYININGQYPPGLFAAECREGKGGLSCEGVPGKGSAATSGAQRTQGRSRALVVLLCGLGAALFH